MVQYFLECDLVYDPVSSCIKDEGQDRGCGPTPHHALPSGGSEAYSHPSELNEWDKNAAQVAAGCSDANINTYACFLVIFLHLF
jgi:hypothetical protein